MAHLEINSTSYQQKNDQPITVFIIYLLNKRIIIRELIK